MVIRAARLAPAGLLLIAAASIPATAMAMQDQPATQSAPAADSRTEIVQVGAPTTDAAQRKPQNKAFLDSARDQQPVPRPSLTQTPSDQIARAAGSAPASQITARSQSGSGVTQLSKSELEATLAQLSAAERRVLLQAIVGTDICDNPPQVAAIITLCQSRLETRSGEFAAMEQGAQSAEEQLLRGEFDNSALPSVSQVIERLARSSGRGSAASDDFNNQAIASIALAPPPEQPGDGELDGAQGLSEPTQALINAIVNQLGGGRP